MKFSEWVKTVPEAIKGDSLWQMKVYQMALFLSDIGWHDVTKLFRDKRTVELSGQLYAALGSIPANISEGYSRGTGRDRARFYEYALGSARESRDWYFMGRHGLGESVVTHRINLLTEIIRILLSIVPKERGNYLREDSPAYIIEGVDTCEGNMAFSPQMADLLEHVPLPHPTEYEIRNT